jgi:hypothetical protein
MSVGGLRRGWERGRVGLCALAAIPAAAAFLAAPAQGAVQCGDTITKSKKLKANVVECPGTALRVDGDGIDLDLNGHTIRTPGEDAIHVVAGSSDIKIHGGKIRNAPDHGILVDETSKLKLSNLSVRGGANRGIQVNDSSSVRISKVEVSDQGEAGVYLSGVEGGHVKLVGIENTVGPGMDLTGLDGVTFAASAILGGEDSDDAAGMTISGVEDVTFENLVTKGWGQDGIAFFPGSGAGHNRFALVTSRSNGDTGFYIGNGDGTKLRGVIAKGNDTEGLFVESDAANVRVSKGIFNSNENGIFFADGSTGSVRDNVANNNAGIGITIPFPSGVTDLGGNRASGNGVVDCVNLACE